jgi:hypothetical protein
MAGVEPHTPAWKWVSALVVLVIGSAIAILLGRYAERDDAPGGVLIAFVILVGAAALAIWIVKQRPESSVRP